MITTVVTRDILMDDINTLRANNMTAWEEALKFRKLVEMVEHYQSTYETCPWCYNIYPNHQDDCPRQLALYPPDEEEPIG